MRSITRGPFLIHNLLLSMPRNNDDGPHIIQRAIHCILISVQQDASCKSYPRSMLSQHRSNQDMKDVGGFLYSLPLSLSRRRFALSFLIVLSASMSMKQLSEPLGISQRPCSCTASRTILGNVATTWPGTKQLPDPGNKSSLCKIDLSHIGSFAHRFRDVFYNWKDIARSADCKHEINAQGRIEPAFYLFESVLRQAAPDEGYLRSK